MIKNIILVTGFVFSSLVFANSSCAENEKSIDKMNVSELKAVRKGLNEKLGDYEFEYHYTLTHNRIHSKTINFHIDKKINPDNKEKILMAKQKVSDALLNINEKSLLIYTTKKQIINSHIKEINKRIEAKNKRDYN